VTVSWRGDQLRKTSLAGINREVCGRLALQDGIALQRVLRSGDALGATPPHPTEIECDISGHMTSGPPPRGWP
jgi:hypothetical protein